MSMPPEKPRPASRQSEKQSRSKPKALTRTSQPKEGRRPDNAQLRRRLLEAEETLNAIRAGEVDALVVAGPQGEQVYTLKGAEQPYRILVESISEGALSVMENGAIMNCNKAFADIAGSTCGMLIGRQFRDFVAAKDLNKFNAFWKLADEREARAELELRFDGGMVPVLISASSRLIDGECWFFVIVADITDLKRTESELARYRDHLEGLVAEKTEEVQATNAELQSANEKLQATNKELLKLTDDMDARNRELEMLNKELDAFVYSVSHDLRAPLRSMSGFARILWDDYAGVLDAQGKDYLSRIQGGADRMSRLLEDLLQLSRIARQDISRAGVNLSEVAETVVYNLRAACPGRDVKVIIEQELRALADPSLIGIAMTNLIGNAWKFTGNTREAVIEFGALRQAEDMAYFVRDNGAGFNQAYADKLFLPFQRLHSDADFEGAGIGLSIVDRIIRRHGGTIWAEGEDGKGATFYFTLGSGGRASASPVTP